MIKVILIAINGGNKAVECGVPSLSEQQSTHSVRHNSGRREDLWCSERNSCDVLFCFVILVLFRSFKNLPPKVNSQLANIMIKKTLVYPHFCDF